MQYHIGGLVIFGIGLESSISVCRTGIFLCIVFYASSKALLYVFLSKQATSIFSLSLMFSSVEKVHVVWSSTPKTPRLKSPVYLVGMGTIVFYTIVGIVMVIGRVSYLRQEDGYCFIGLKFYSSVALLSYDLWVVVTQPNRNLCSCLKQLHYPPSYWTLSLAFIAIQLHKLASPLSGPSDYDVSLNLVWWHAEVHHTSYSSSSVALVMSTVNIAVLAAYHGNERGWMCLGCCTTDVSSSQTKCVLTPQLCAMQIIFNALALFWVTRDTQSSIPSSHPNAPAGGQNRYAKEQTPAVVIMNENSLQGPVTSAEGLQIKQGFTRSTSNSASKLLFKFDRVDASEQIEMRSQTESTFQPVEVMVNTIRERDDDSYEVC